MIITTLSPFKDKEYQGEVLNSWKDSGHEIISINHKSEIELLKDFDVNFVEPIKTGFDLFGKHYIPINEIINVLNDNGDGVILNSDIILNGLPKLDRALILSRYDFDTDISNSKKFISGFDGFYLKKQHCELLSESKLCLGQCHWDYWLPYMLIKSGVELYSPQNKYLYHKKHPIQQNINQWKMTAQIFKNETGLNGSLQTISNEAHAFINQNIKTIRHF